MCLWCRSTGKVDSSRKRNDLSGRIYTDILKNGFIAKLDFYIWEQTCQLLKQWMVEGLNPDPVSVNISRVNLYNPQLLQIMQDLMKKYNIPHHLLNLEQTESAYMDNPELIRQTIAELQKAGFTIMMDDFGSGFSLLNTLKDIFIDVLKVDMRFAKRRRKRRMCRLNRSIKMYRDGKSKFDSSYGVYKGKRTYLLTLFTSMDECGTGSPCEMNRDEVCQSNYSLKTEKQV